MKQLLDEIKKLITDGQAGLAQERLKAVKQIPREELFRVANLWRRAGGSEMAIRLLGPIVNPKNKEDTKATPIEKAVYAGALIKLGVLEEAFNILKKLDAKKIPEVSLFTGYGQISAWNYAQAIEPLKQFLDFPDVDEETRVLAKLDLAACYVDEGYQAEAESLLKELRTETLEKKLNVPYANSLELSAQWAIRHKRWGEAREFLDEAAKLMRGAETVYAFYIRKWKWVLELCEAKNPASKMNQMYILKVEAEKYKKWESIRDIDFWRAVRTADPLLITHVYYGTPYEVFRKRLFTGSAGPTSIPDTYEWNANSVGVRATKTIKVLSDPDPKSEFARNSISSRLLRVLVSDLYRPFRMEMLHSLLYPETLFDPDSSPNRVHQAIWTLRSHLERESIPLSIQHTVDGFRLEMKQGYCLTIPKNLMQGKTVVSDFDRLKNAFGDNLFTSAEAEAILGISRTSVNRFLKKATEEGALVREGYGSTFRYQVSGSANLKKARG